MVVDGGGEGGKKLPVVESGDDLAQYRLDDYDDDVDEEGACVRGWAGVLSSLCHSSR